jgi:hypothetical protein
MAVAAYIMDAETALEDDLQFRGEAVRWVTLW